MTVIHVAIGSIWVLSLVAGRAWWPLGPAYSVAATSAEITARPTQAPGEVTGAPRMEHGDPADPRTDLFGNEVEEALADYRIDLRGDVYERHSPDTAVPRLGPPTS